MSSIEERGSALMLVPAGMLVLMLLGAISVDSAIAFMAQRELANSAAAAVNDAATLSLSDEELQKGPDARPDPARASEVVHRALDGLKVGGMTVKPEDVTVSVDTDARQVTVEVEGEAPYIFAGAIPGAKNSAHVRAVSTAELRFAGPGIDG